MQADTARLPFFEVVTPAANAAARRLTTATKVQSQLGIGTTDTTLIEELIDFVSADAVKYAGLARASVGTAVPTFGSETLRATYFPSPLCREKRLLLPWRAPMVSITSVVEDTTTLTAETDYKLMEGGMLARRSSENEVYWPQCKIVVVFIAGWTLPTNVPADLEEAVIDQVKYKYLSRARDNTLRAQAVPNVYSAQYSVAGGDSISKSGLLKSLENALTPYSNMSAV